MTPEEAIKIIKSERDGIPSDLDANETIEAFTMGMEALKNISKPAGEWIPKEETFEDLSGSIETYTRSTCSVCNQANGWGEVPYCPWCGARMEKRDDQHRETDQEQTGGNQEAD